MATQILEGTWEEIQEHAAELAGRRLRVTVLEDDGVTFAYGPEERRAKLLAWVDERRRTPLTEEDVRVLDEFEEFRKEHPFSLRSVDLDQ